MNKYKIKPFEELTLADDFMFGEVMRNEHTCKLFLEAVLQTKLKSIEIALKEATFKDRYASRGIRLDIFAEDDAGNYYNIEMQNSNTHNLLLRNRYYVASMDRRSLERSNEYDKLPLSCVIFICTFDYVGRGLAKYEKTSYFNSDLSMPVDDRTRFILLNSHYKTLNADALIAEFLDIINGMNQKWQSELAQNVTRRIRNIQASNYMKEDYIMSELQYRERMQEIERIGFAKGHAEGLERGHSEGFVKGIEEERQRNIKVLKSLGISEDQYFDVLKQMEELDK